jgi:cobalamin biosynthesis protein CobW
LQQRIPATVITGFLGAGKTTLIRNLLMKADGERLALIINEFGDVGVDASLAKECGASSCDADSIIELANGCICCTVADDFMPSMEALLNQSPPPDRIIIETSGLALPQPLVQAFQWPSIRTRAMLDGVVTVVDGPALAMGQVASDMSALEAQRQLDPELDHDTPINELFHDQLSAANILVMAKTDLMTKEDKAKVRDKLGRLMAQDTPVIETDASNAPMGAIFGLGLEDEAFARSEHSLHDHHHDHDDDDHDDHDDDHHHDHGHDAFKTVIMTLPPLGDSVDIVHAIRDLAGPGGILRAKGFLAVQGKVAPLVIQAVGSRVDHYYAQKDMLGDSQDPDMAAGLGRLVVIGYADMDVSGLAERVGGQIT